jgi:hypothetical protein
VTLHNFGFSDAAEVFVGLAGYAAFLAYGKTFAESGAVAGTLKLGRRIRDLYVAHVVLLCVCVGGLAIAARGFQNPLYFEHVNLTPFNHDAAGAIWRALILLYQPGYLNILPLYILLLIWLPLLLWLMRRNVLLALAASFLVWLPTALLQWNLPSYPDHFGWVFNPFAWQLLFSVGAIGAYLVANGSSSPRRGALFWIALGYVLFAFLVAAPWTNLPGLADARLFPADVRAAMSKQNLSLWRLAHIAALAYIAASLIPPRADWLSNAWARWVVNCGRHSLPVFCLGTALSMAGFVVMVEAGRGLASQIVVNVTGLALLGFTAWTLARLKRARAPREFARTGDAKFGWLFLQRRQH